MQVKTLFIFAILFVLGSVTLADGLNKKRSLRSSFTISADDINGSLVETSNIPKEIEAPRRSLRSSTEDINVTREIDNEI